MTKMCKTKARGLDAHAFSLPIPIVREVFQAMQINVTILSKGSIEICTDIEIPCNLQQYV